MALMLLDEFPTFDPIDLYCVFDNDERRYFLKGRVKGRMEFGGTDT